MDASIIWRHHWAIYRAALRALGDVDDAEDVAQQVMIAGVEGWGQAKRDCALMTWLWAIMLCRIAKVYRQRDKDTRLIERIKERMVNDVEEEDDKAERVWAVLDKLPPDKRVILALEYLDGHSVADVARIMGYTQRHAETEVTRARALFKRMWGDGEDK